jgi:hypothetical protein
LCFILFKQIEPYRGGAFSLDIQFIISEMEAERDRVNQAIGALQGRGSKQTKTSTGRPDGRRRRLSAAARKRIGDAMKKRWAERKKKQVA